MSLAQRTVNEKIDKIMQNSQVAEMNNFGKNDDFDQKIYATWNFQGYAGR